MTEAGRLCLAHTHRNVTCEKSKDVNNACGKLHDTVVRVCAYVNVSVYSMISGFCAVDV